MQIASIGIDLGKTTFHLVALGPAGQVLVRRKFWTRIAGMTMIARYATANDLLYMSSMPFEHPDAHYHDRAGISSRIEQNGFRQREPPPRDGFALGYPSSSSG
jgi:hypothetical protein